MRPTTACWVISNASSTPASAIRGPPAPKNEISVPTASFRSAFTSSAASKSPLGSPATSMKERRFMPFVSAEDQVELCQGSGPFVRRNLYTSAPEAEMQNAQDGGTNGREIRTDPEG